MDILRQNKKYKEYLMFMYPIRAADEYISTYNFLKFSPENNKVPPRRKMRHANLSP